IFGFHLVIERLRIVIIDQDEGFPGCESVDDLEDLRMALRRHEAAHINGFDGAGGFCHFWPPWAEGPLAGGARRLQRPGGIMADGSAPANMGKASPVKDTLSIYLLA